MPSKQLKRVIILGARGRLGSELCRQWEKNKSVLQLSEVIGLGHADIDFADPSAAVHALEQQVLQPGDIVINTAAITDVDHCEREQGLATIVNATTPGLLAKHAAERDVRFIHLSTDYVFDGASKQAYVETDKPSPLGHYGASKLAGEKLVMEASVNHVIARVSWVFGPDKPSFIDQILKTALISTDVAAVHDKISSPTYTKDLAQWLTAFFSVSGLGGIYHLCNSGACSWRDYGEYALQVAKRHGMAVLTTSVAPLKMTEITRFVAARPPYTPLDTTKFRRATGHTPRSWQEAVEDYLGDRS